MDVILENSGICNYGRHTDISGNNNFYVSA